jgi:hypothetical protein
MTVEAASMPCLRALKLEAALPSGVRGPVDFWALPVFTILLIPSRSF